MSNEEIVFIKNVLSQWNQNNVPEFYVPYKEGDYVFIYGDCTGIVMYPFSYEFDGKILNEFLYLFLEEDDGCYFCSPNKHEKNVYWMKNDLKCLEVAMKYIQENTK